MKTEKDSGGSQVIARAAMILRTLETRPEGLTISELSRQSGLARATVHRLVSSLVQHQLLLGTDGCIRLGPGLTKLAAAAHIDVIALSRSSMETLGRRTRETIDLSIYRGSHAVSVSQFASDQELRVISAVGTAFPIHSTAHGKVLLAELSDDKIAELIGDVPEVRTNSTHTSLVSLLIDINHIRKCGYAVDREEHARGVCGLGVIINGDLNETYAVSIAVPALRFEENFATLLCALLQCKSEIEALLRS